MFFVFNKQKIYSYVVAVSTVMLLLGIAMYAEKNNETIETSSKIQNKLPIYSVETEDKNISLTINCAW